MVSVLDEVKQERERQDAMWGGPDHDNYHGPDQWCCLLMERLGKAADMGISRDTFRRRLVQVAALAVAAIEVCDRLDTDE